MRNYYSWNNFNYIIICAYTKIQICSNLFALNLDDVRYYNFKHEW